MLLGSPGGSAQVERRHIWSPELPLGPTRTEATGTQLPSCQVPGMAPQEPSFPLTRPDLMRTARSRERKKLTARKTDKEGGASSTIETNRAGWEFQLPHSLNSEETLNFSPLNLHPYLQNGSRPAQGGGTFKIISPFT
uniref:Uncharacterized protein n=1 Tax=Myotis myotis TaxID=51298 RepID=A0A7J7TJN3_MYOMY|nr:hypothetical protein mMyoMyo1_009038 [Myotis myotis]